jgi:hypothetical protein
VKEVHPRYHEVRVRAIEPIRAHTRGVWVGVIKIADVKEGVCLCHVHRHVVGPFEHLGTDANQEGFRKPAAKQHDAVTGVVHEKQGHTAPDRIDLVPISWGSKPNSALPPP